MKSVLFGWLLGLVLMASHMGCCSIQMVGHGFESGACGDVCSDGCGDCNGVGAIGTLRSRIADRIRTTNCGSGCGEIYWDEQINEPPVCDPCGCDGQFECGSCRSCPSALGRLRSLWGYRYQPSSCEECSSCGTTAMSGGSGCSTCAGNTQIESEHMIPLNAHMHSSSPTSSRMPTPAVRPQPARESGNAPVPVPDSNAMLDTRPDPRNRTAIGSGVSAKSKQTAARPVSINAKQTVQGKPRLVTNPR